MASDESFGSFVHLFLSCSQASVGAAASAGPLGSGLDPGALRRSLAGLRAHAQAPDASPLVATAAPLLLRPLIDVFGRLHAYILAQGAENAASAATRDACDALEALLDATDALLQAAGPRLVAEKAEAPSVATQMTAMALETESRAALRGAVGPAREEAILEKVIRVARSAFAFGALEPGVFGRPFGDEGLAESAREAILHCWRAGGGGLVPQLALGLLDVAADEAAPKACRLCAAEAMEAAVAALWSADLWRAMVPGILSRMQRIMLNEDATQSAKLTAAAFGAVGRLLRLVFDDLSCGHLPCAPMQHPGDSDGDAPPGSGSAARAFGAFESSITSASAGAAGDGGAFTPPPRPGGLAIPSQAADAAWWHDVRGKAWLLLPRALARGGHHGSARARLRCAILSRELLSSCRRFLGVPSAAAEAGLGLDPSPLCRAAVANLAAAAVDADAAVRGLGRSSCAALLAGAGDLRSALRRSFLSRAVSASALDAAKALSRSLSRDAAHVAAAGNALFGLVRIADGDAHAESAAAALTRAMEPPTPVGAAPSMVAGMCPPVREARGSAAFQWVAFERHAFDAARGGAAAEAVACCAVAMGGRPEALRSAAEELSRGALGGLLLAEGGAEGGALRVGGETVAGLRRIAGGAALLAHLCEGVLRALRGDEELQDVEGAAEDGGAEQEGDGEGGAEAPCADIAEERGEGPGAGAPAAEGAAPGGRDAPGTGSADADDRLAALALIADGLFGPLCHVPPLTADPKATGLAPALLWDRAGASLCEALSAVGAALLTASRGTDRAEEVLSQLLPSLLRRCAGVGAEAFAAKAALGRICIACGSGSVAELLRDNLDYVADALGRDLRAAGGGDGAAAAALLSAVLRLAGENAALPLLEEVCDAAMERVDACMASRRRTQAQLRAFAEVVRTVVHSLRGVTEEDCAAAEAAGAAAAEGVVLGVLVQHRADEAMPEEREPHYLNALLDDFKMPEENGAADLQRRDGESAEAFFLRLAAERDARPDEAGGAPKSTAEEDLEDLRARTPSRRQHIALCALRRAAAMLAVDDPVARNHAAEAVSAAIGILRGRRRLLLPVLAQLWPVAMSRLDAAAKDISRGGDAGGGGGSGGGSVVAPLRAVVPLCELVGEICGAAPSFLQGRIVEELWPRLRAALRGAQAAAGRVGGADGPRERCIEAALALLAQVCRERQLADGLRTVLLEMGACGVGLLCGGERGRVEEAAEAWLDALAGVDKDLFLGGLLLPLLPEEDRPGAARPRPRPLETTAAVYIRDAAARILDDRAPTRFYYAAMG